MTPAPDDEQRLADRQCRATLSIVDVRIDGDRATHQAQQLISVKTQ
ncbi:MAG: hypothetical protein WDM77_02555 [Steroidobacteraceae bacterium]